MFCGCCTTWLLAAPGRREAPLSASGPIVSPHDETWAADRSHRRLATLDIDRIIRRTGFRSASPDNVKDGTPDQRAVLQAFA